jgi:hypothetical protein
MSAITPPPPVEVDLRGPQEPGGSGPHEEPLPQPKRNSVYPLLVDIGAVMAAFGLIIGGPLWGSTVSAVLIGLGLAIVAFGGFGWWREARADYRRLPD